jgi:hypothetical protein
LSASIRLSAAQERARAIRTQLSGARSLWALAEALVGLHAARHSGPYVAAHGRCAAALDREHGRQPTHGGLVHVRVMRGTLHAMSPGVAAEAVVATAEQREAVARRRLHVAGITPRHVSRIAAELFEKAARPCHEGLLHGGDPLRRAVLRWLWDRGAVVAYDVSGTPHRKERASCALTRSPAGRTQRRPSRSLAYCEGTWPHMDPFRSRTPHGGQVGEFDGLSERCARCLEKSWPCASKAWTRRSWP